MQKFNIYTQYPFSNVIIYNVTTITHFVLGGLGIILGFRTWIGYVFGSLYLVFAFTQMYVIMPLSVCPSCVYYRMDNSLCPSGLNQISKKIAHEGNENDFKNRAYGLLCHNNLYMAALFIPIIVMVPALIMDYSFTELAILLAVTGLLVFRFFVIIPKMACIHCAARKQCPNAQAMGMDK